MLGIFGKCRAAPLIHPMAQQVDSVRFVITVEQRAGGGRVCLHGDVHNIGFAHNPDDNFAHNILPLSYRCVGALLWL